MQRELLGEVIMNCRYSYSKGHDYDKNHVVSDKHTPYLTISCSRGTSWNSDKWETLQEAYENKGYKTYLRNQVEQHEQINEYSQLCICYI